MAAEPAVSETARKQLHLGVRMAIPLASNITVLVRFGTGLLRLRLVASVGPWAGQCGRITTMRLRRKPRNDHISLAWRRGNRCAKLCGRTRM